MPAVVLHTRFFRERSRILELMTQDAGRKAVVGFGRYASLNPFSLLLLRWRGNPEFPRLSEVEILRSFVLEGRPLVCALYLNELVVKLLPRDFPSAPVFSALILAYSELQKGLPPDILLRRAEWALLQEMDSGLMYIAQHNLQDDVWYHYVPEEGLMPAVLDRRGASISGRGLRVLIQQLPVPDDLRGELRDFMRSLIRYHLNGQEIQTRHLL